MIRRIDQNGIISTLLGFNDLTSARPLSCESVMDISQVGSLLEFPLRLSHPSCFFIKVRFWQDLWKASTTILFCHHVRCSHHVSLSEGEGLQLTSLQGRSGVFVFPWVPVTQMLPAAAGLRNPVSSWPTTWATELLPPSQKHAGIHAHRDVHSLVSLGAVNQSKCYLSPQARTLHWLPSLRYHFGMWRCPRGPVLELFRLLWFSFTLFCTQRSPSVKTINNSCGYNDKENIVDCNKLLPWFYCKCLHYAFLYQILCFGWSKLKCSVTD